MFGELKNFSNFAASSPKTIFSILACAAVLIAAYSANCAANIGYHSLVSCCTAKSVIVFGETGGDSLFYINTLIFQSQMPKTMKIQSGAKYSNAAMTSAYESGSDATQKLQVSPDTVCFSDLVAEMQKHFDIEKNAKNKAYAFILACGLFSQFAKFCQHCHSDDWHDTCLKQLVINES